MNRLITFFAYIAFVASSALAHDFEVGGIYYVKNSDGTSVSVSYKGTSYGEYLNEYSGSVTIPPSVTYSGETYSVTSIGKHAFSRCSGLASVTIPNSVTSIGSYAFSGCSGLMSVSIGNSVTTIFDFSFSDCSGLTSIEIPHSVSKIFPRAFDGCSGLKSITIPNSVTSIYSSAFSDCSGLTSIVVEQGNTMYDSRNNCNAIIKTSNNELICGCKNTVIPNSVTSIGYEAFRGCSGLTGTLTIPNSVTSIGNQAFSGCSGLTSITIPNSVTSIGSSAFSGCSGLTSVTIPNSVTEIGDGAFGGTSWFNNQPDGLVYAGNVAYTYKGIMPSGTFISINEGTVSISPYCFQNCSGLTSVTIPNSVKSIGSMAFYNTAWYNNQPAGLVYAGRVAYKYKGTMPSNTSIALKEGTASISPDCFSDCTGLTSVTIPNSVTSIGDAAFQLCSGLTSLTIPRSVTKIGEMAFMGCYGLNSIVVDYGNIKYDSRNNCNAIIETTSNSLIAGCNNTSIPKAITSINYFAFAGCSGLTSVTIPNSVTSIGQCAFYGCSGLTSIDWNAKNSEIYFVLDDRVFLFGENTSVKTVVFGEDVEHIPEGVCCGLGGLKSVTIGSGVNSIGDYAFENCKELITVTNNALTPQRINATVFNGVDVSYCTLLIPEESFDFYNHVTYWKDFFVKINSVEGVEVDEATKEVEGYYDLKGIRLEEPIRGQVNIVRYTDGTSQKVVVKE